jgi:transcriptional regulator with XRE-family HTH domain
MSDNQANDASFYLILGDRIRLARIEAGMDQDAFAISVNLTRSSIANIEKGRQRPSAYLLWLMARNLSISINDLYPPIDVTKQIDDWALRIEKNIDLLDENQRKRLIDFISATRNIK